MDTRYSKTKKAKKLKKSKICFLSGLSITALLILSISGCSESPLDSLKEIQPSAQYTESFWSTQQKINSILWQQATKICSDETYSSTPNCGSIHDIQMFAHPLPYHKYGTGKGFGEMPEIK